MSLGIDQVLAKQALKVASERAQSGVKAPKTGPSSFDKLLGRLSQRSAVASDLLTPKSIQPVNGQVGTQVGVQQASHNGDKGIGRLMNFFSEVNQGQLSGKRLMDMLLQNRKMSHHEIFMAQVEMHRIAIQLEFTGKLVESSSSGLNRMLNTQIS